MFKCISERLKNNGYTPKYIFDIGAHKGFWTSECINIYPDSQYLLFEPTHYPELEYYKNISNIKVFNALLDTEVHTVDWYEINGTGDSIFKELSHHYTDCLPLKKQTNTLENILTENTDISELHNIFIKIDCQGAEIPILKGSGKILEKTDFILMEMPFFGQYNENVPSFMEHIQYMDSIGFIPFDIAEIHYIHNFTLQTDVLFINKCHEFNNKIKELLYCNN